MRAHFLALCLLAVPALALVTVSAPAWSDGWKDAKNTADDVIYAGKDRTFYCGCIYTSHGDTDGSGDVDHDACGYEKPEKHIARADRVECPRRADVGALLVILSRRTSCRLPTTVRNTWHGG